MIKRTDGFTVIELIIIVLVLGTASLLFFMQKSNIETAARDQQRKTAINAMYYSLEEVFYNTNKFYPSVINAKNIPSVDPTLFIDPNKVEIGQAGSNYQYEPTNCTNNECESYTLRTTLENEADFIKKSKNN